MKLKIYGREDSPKSITLRLVPDGKDVELIAVDAKGDKISKSSLLVICANGKFKRPSSVNPKLGFKLGLGGYIMMEKY